MADVCLMLTCGMTICLQIRCLLLIPKDCGGVRPSIAQPLGARLECTGWSHGLYEMDLYAIMDSDAARQCLSLYGLEFETVAFGGRCTAPPSSTGLVASALSGSPSLSFLV